MPPIRVLLSVVLTLVICAASLAADLPAKAKTAAPPEAKAPSVHAVVQKLGQLPLRFEPNQGQSDARVKYLAHGPGYTLFLTSEEAVLALAKPAEERERGKRGKHSMEESEAPAGFEMSVVRMRILGTDPNAAVIPEAPQPGVTNYFIGNDPKQWRRGVPGYGRVRYQAIYPGIDVTFYGNPQRLEYDFAAAPGADPSKIQLAFEGTDKIEKSPSGDLLLRAGGQIVTVHKPVVYQADKKQLIDAEFVLRADNRVGFTLGAYDHSQTLTIDPVLTYSSYIGGSALDIPHGVRVDPQGNIVIAGVTQSPDFPIVGGYQGASLRGASDIFVAKLEPLGRFLLWSSFVGGSGNDGDFGRFTDNGLAVDGNGNVYVSDTTPSADFPVVNAVQPVFGGGTTDGIVFELSSDGKTLVFSTFLGGSGQDYPTSIALDAAADIIVGGGTGSADFPTANPLRTIAPALGVYQWSGEAWFELSNSGLNVRQFTSIAVDPSNPAILYAATGSGGVYKSTDTGSHWSFSGLGHLTVSSIAVDPSNSANLYAATSGGIYTSTNGGTSWALTGPNTANTLSIAVDPQAPNVVIAGTSGNIFRSTASGVAGSWVLTTSPGGGATNKLTFDPTNPTRVYAARGTGVWVSHDTGGSWTIMSSPLPNSTAVAVDPFNSNVLYAGSLDNSGAGLDKLYKSTDGGVTWAGILGGGVRDVVTSPVNANTLYVVGRVGFFRSSSAGASFNPRELAYLQLSHLAVVGGTPDTIYTGTAGGQGVVTKLSPGGAGIIYSTYIPADRNIYVQGVASDPAGNAVAAGATGTDQGLALVNAFQSSNNNGDSCYVARINASGTAFTFATLIGGSTGYTECRAAGSDSAGNAYITGSTGDTDFPLMNPVQGAYGGGPGELFITKFSPTGAVLYSTYWGGAGDEDGQSLFVDGTGNLYLTGDTGSVNFPLVNPIQPTAGFPQNDAGPENAVVMKFDPNGNVLFASYLGGSSGGFDGGRGIAANASGDIYVTGTTTSSNFPLAGQPFQSTDNTLGNGTAFISKIAFFPPAVQLTSTLVQFGGVTQNLTSPPQVVTLTNVGTGPLTFAHINYGNHPVNPGSPFFINTDCPQVLPAGNSCHGSFTFTPPTVGEFSDQLQIIDDAVDSPQIIQFTGNGTPTLAGALVTPSALHFGNVAQNFTSPGQDVTITSTGDAPLIFNSISTTDPQFAILNNTCPQSPNGLNPGYSCTVTVDVTPAVVGFISANLVISDDTVNSPQVVSLDATGIQTQTVTQPLSPTQPTTFTFPGQTYNYSIQFPPGSNFSGVTASVTVGPTTLTDFQTRVAGSFPGAQCIQYSGANGTCTVFQVKCTPSPCPSSAQPNIVVKTAFDSTQVIINPGFLQAESGTNAWQNIFTDFYLPKVDGTIKGGTTGFSDFVAVLLPAPSNVPAGMFVGFKTPLATTNTRVFTVGTMIPVKFSLYRIGATSTGGGSAWVTNATARLSLITGTTPEPVKLAGPNGALPNLFVYSPITHMYEYDLDTTGLPPGQYQLTVVSDSFAAQQVTFTLH